MLDPGSIARLRAGRARRDGPPGPRRPGVWLAVLLLHVLFTLFTVREMNAPPPRPGPPRAHGAVMQVRLIRTVAPPPAPLPAPLPATAPARPPSAAAATAAAVGPAKPGRPAPAATPALRLYDRTGQPRLPAVAQSAAPAPGYVARLPRDRAGIMRHADPLPYRATRFESAFPPPDETALGAAVRGVLRGTHTNEARRVDLPGGLHLKCKTLFGLPTPICHEPPPVPSKKDGDERLDMAPARPLASGLRPARHDLADCIARYRRGEPLPQGCPVDTPVRAVDAECVEAAAAGKPLPGHCRQP